VRHTVVIVRPLPKKEVKPRAGVGAAEG
jgi:hypothetical protein